MKKLMLFLLISYVYGCTQIEPGVKLEKGTNDYELAVKLAEKFPSFNPDENKIIGTTTKFEVTVGDITLRIRANFGSRADQILGRPDADIKRILNEFATNIALTKITLIEAEKEGIVVEDSLINNIINTQITRMGGREKFLQFLQENGAEEEKVFQDIKIGEIHKKYVNKMREQLSTVTEDDIEEALQGDRLATVRHILLMTQGKSEEDKLTIHKKMEDILTEAKSGADFAELATKYTEDPGSKPNGGLYKDFPKGQMVPAFEEAAFTVPVGEISDIVETPYGYHILKVEERKKEDRPIEQVKVELQKSKEKSVIFDLYEKLKKEYELNLQEIS